VIGRKKKYINIFGSFREHFNLLSNAAMRTRSLAVANRTSALMLQNLAQYAAPPPRAGDILASLTL